MYNDSQLEDIFTYHAPTPEQQIQYTNIRAGALTFARILVQNSPSSADQTTAMRKLRECVMTINAAIARNGRASG